jgi:hypothetical protein
MLTTDYFSDEPIPPRRDGLDEAGLFSVVGQRGANRPNAPGQRRLIDDGLRPQRLEQFLAGEQLARPLD